MDISPADSEQHWSIDKTALRLFSDPPCAVVFQIQNGDTHLLNELGTAILHCLDESPLSESAIIERIVTYLDCESNKEMVEGVSEALRELTQLELLQKQRP